MKIPTEYIGREQSYIKHRLLEGYLERLIMIVGHGRASTISYVDCFAGPWPDEVETVSSTSVGISLNIMQACRNAYAKRGKDVPRFRALYVEKDKTRFSKLQEHMANAPAGLEAQALHGDFNSLQADILQWCGSTDFTFFLIDPKGWKDVPMSNLRPLLERPNSEFLITLMYDFVNRAVPQERFAKDMHHLFSEHVRVVDNLAPKDREVALLDLYKKRLREAVPKSGERPYCVNVRVMDPLKNRTKYHLVYLTRHPKGIQVFMQQSEKLDIVQEQVRIQAQADHQFRVTGSQQMGFDLGKMPDANDALNAYQARHSARQFWLSKISDQPQVFGLAELAAMIEETGWFISTLQNALGDLIEEGKVRNIDASRKRPSTTAALM